MSSSSTHALIVGATGNVGRHLLDELSNSKTSGVKATVLVRGATLEDSKKKDMIEKWKNSGIKFVTADLDKEDTSSLVSKLKEIQPTFDVLLSLVGASQKKDGQLKLIDVAKQLNINWFIPSEIGYKYEQIGRNSPATWFDTNIDIRDAIRDAKLHYTWLATGFLAEYVLSPSTGIDIKNRTITAAGSLNNKITITSLRDTAKYIVAMLQKPDKAKDVEALLYSDTLTYNDIADILDKHFDTKFKRTEQTLDELKKAEQTASEKDKKTYGFMQVIASQDGTYWEPNETWNAKYASDIKPTSLAEYVKQNVKA